MITVAAPITIDTTPTNLAREHSAACDEALVELDAQSRRDAGRCRSCGAQAVFWNPHNHVVQCHACGLAALRDEDLEDLAIAAAAHLEAHRQRADLQVADLLRALARRLRHSQAVEAELEAELEALRTHVTASTPASSGEASTL